MKMLCISMLILATVQYAIAVSCCSVCECKSHEVWCEYRNLETVPDDIPVNTRRLYLFNNKISTLSQGAFKQLKKLELLDLSSNQLTSAAIRPGLFDGLEHLGDIILTNNSLTHIKEKIFSEIPSLLRLYIEDNMVRRIDEHAFTNLHNLVELKLSRNQLIEFPKLINCPNLRRLYLSNNKIIRLQDQTLSQVNLEQLTLSNNKLNQLPTTIFREVSNMRKLDLSRNRISKIPRIINNMNFLQTLNLSGNSISFVHDNFLSSLRRMKVLDLKGLRLTTLGREFIPQRVYLNVFDVSDNPWTCDCRILWLTEYMRIVSSAFVGMSQVRCSEPASLRGNQLVTLYERDLNCNSDSNQPQNSNQVLATVNSCDEMKCIKSYNCFLDEETKKPTCRCLPGWKGTLCNTSDITTFFLGVTPESFILNNTLTSTSVKIRLPANNQLITITTLELGPQSSRREKVLTTLTSFGDDHEVDKLHPASSYRICIRSAQQFPHMHKPVHGLEKELCGTMKTKGSSIFSSEIDHTLYYDDTDIDNNLADIGQRENRINKIDEQEKFSSENGESKLIWPVLAACIAIIIIVAIGAFFCYRSKRFRSNGNDITESMTEYKSQNLRYPSEDIVPMIQQQCDYTLIPKSYSGESTTSTRLSEDIYQLPLQQLSRQYTVKYHNGDFTCRTSPHDFEIVDYKKYQHANFSLSNTWNTQKEQEVHNKSNVVHRESHPFYEGHDHETMHRQNNRREFISEPQSATLPKNISNRLDREAYTVPVSFQQYCDERHSDRSGVNCGLTVGSTDQVHNSLKLRTNYLGVVPPQSTQSLQLPSERKLNQTALQNNNACYDFNARHAATPPNYSSIRPGQKTIVV